MPTNDTYPPEAVALVCETVAGSKTLELLSGERSALLQASETLKRLANAASLPAITEKQARDLLYQNHKHIANNGDCMLIDMPAAIRAIIQAVATFSPAVIQKEEVR